MRCCSSPIRPRRRCRSSSPTEACPPSVLAEAMRQIGELRLPRAAARGPADADRRCRVSGLPGSATEQARTADHAGRGEGAAGRLVHRGAGVERQPGAGVRHARGRAAAVPAAARLRDPRRTDERTAVRSLRHAARRRQFRRAQLPDTCGRRSWWSSRRSRSKSAATSRCRAASAAAPPPPLPDCCSTSASPALATAAIC